LDDKYPSTNVGKLPIHFAAQWDSYEICKFIIENGGDPNPTLNDGTSALELAGTNENIRDLILKKSKENQTPNV
jgi:ankyrin repeat protein